MSTFYEVWDDSTGNRLGEYVTLADARAVLHAILASSGPGSVSDLSVLVYTPTENDGYDVKTVLEGADFAASAHGNSASSVDSAGGDAIRGSRVERSA